MSIRDDNRNDATSAQRHEVTPMKSQQLRVLLFAQLLPAGQL